jgi:hypothetical protein
MILINKKRYSLINLKSSVAILLNFIPDSIVNKFVTCIIIHMSYFSSYHRIKYCCVIIKISTTYLYTGLIYTPYIIPRNFFNL